MRNRSHTWNSSPHECEPTRCKNFRATWSPCLEPEPRCGYPIQEPHLRPDTRSALEAMFHQSVSCSAESFIRVLKRTLGGADMGAI